MTRSSSRQSRTIPAIFAVPILLAIASSTGLVAALLTDGPFDLLWSAIVAAPLLMLGWMLIRR